MVRRGRGVWTPHPRPGSYRPCHPCQDLDPRSCSRTQQPRCKEAQAGPRRHPTGKEWRPQLARLCLAGCGSEASQPGDSALNPHQTTLADTPYTRVKLPASFRAPDSSQPSINKTVVSNHKALGWLSLGEIIGAVLRPVGEKGQVPALLQLHAPASRGMTPAGLRADGDVNTCSVLHGSGLAPGGPQSQGSGSA